MIIKIAAEVGPFAEDKDAARDIRVEKIEPALKRGEKGIVLDFSDVDLTTQSFIHAMISAIIRTHGPEVLSRLEFRKCNEGVRRLIEIVVEYSQDMSGPAPLDEDDRTTSHQTVLPSGAGSS
jgi:hypothetical protein